MPLLPRMDEVLIFMTAESRLTFWYVLRIWTLRHFWLSLVVNDVRNRYRRSLLGVGWSLVRPMGMTAIFCFVFGTLFDRDLSTYAPYVLIGMTTWQFLSDSLLGGCHCFAAGASYIRQQKIPLVIFPLRAVLGAGFHFLVAFTLGIAVVAYFQGIPSVAHLLFLPLAMLILLALGWSLAILAGVAQTHFPDSMHLFEIGLQLLFFLTPITYRAADFPSNRLSAAMAFNPAQSILELFRQPLLYGKTPSFFDLGLSLGFVVIVASLAAFCLRRLERTLVFWL